MNILLINKFFWRKGGSETVFFDEIRMLEAAGHTVVPFSMKNKNNYDSKYMSFFVDEVDYTKKGVLNRITSALKIIYSIDANKKIKKLLNNINPEIAHFHIFQHQISPSVFGPLRKKNIPIVLTLHDLKPLCPNYKMYVNGHVCEKCKGQKFYNCFFNSCTKGSRVQSLVNTIEMYVHYFFRYYQNVDKYIAVSHFHKNKMIEYGFDANKIDCIPNFIDLEKYQLSNIDDNYVIYFGRLSYEKGVDTLIEAATLTPEIPIKIVGTGPEEKDLKDLVRTLKIENIEFCGYKTGNALIDLISNSSFSVIPSIVYENCPLTILESFALGKAVIGSRIGGIPELINEGNDGLTFTPGDSKDLSDKIIDLWCSHEKRKKMGINGRNKVEVKFTPEQHYKKLMSTYSSLMK